MDSVTSTDIDWLRAEIKDIKEMMSNMISKSDNQDDKISSLDNRLSLTELKVATLQQEVDDHKTTHKETVQSGIGAKHFYIATLLTIVSIIVAFVAINPPTP